MLPVPAGGLPIECRGLAADRCRDVVVELAPGEVAQRVVVSCVGRCDDRGGEIRMDVVLASGQPRLVGNGGYGEFEQSC